MKPWGPLKRAQWPITAKEVFYWKYAAVCSQQREWKTARCPAVCRVVLTKRPEYTVQHSWAACEYAVQWADGRCHVKGPKFPQTLCTATPRWHRGARRGAHVPCCRPGVVEMFSCGGCQRRWRTPPIPWLWGQAAHVSPPVTRCPCPAQGGHPGAQGAMILAWPGADELMLHGQRRVIDVCFVDVSFCFFSYHGNFNIMTKHLLFLLEPQLLSCPAGYFGIQWLLF